MSNFFDDGFSEIEMLEEEAELEDSEEEQIDDEESDEEIEQEEKTSYSLSRQEKSVVNEAMLRLEQARLYEMLLKHNFFDGIRINPLAKQNVEQELKKFILERLEILLGIKQEEAQDIGSSLTVDLPFNSVEIEFLKALAYKGTNGASVSAVPAQAQATIQPLKTSPRQEGLKPLAQPKLNSIKKIQPTKQVERPAKQVKPRVQERQVRAKRGARTVEEIAKEDLDRMKNRKPAHEMTVKELIAANKRIGGGSRPKPKDALPMPTPEQQVALATSNRQLSGANSGFNEIISKALGAIPIETVSDD